jgi:hypothetical protein
MFVLNTDQNFAQFSVGRHLFILWQEFANDISHRKVVVTDHYAAHIVLSTQNFTRDLDTGCLFSEVCCLHGQGSRRATLSTYLKHQKVPHSSTLNFFTATNLILPTVQLPGGLHAISKRIQSRKIQELLDEMIEFRTGCTCRLISASMLLNCGGCSPLLHGWDRSRHEPANKREGH